MLSEEREFFDERLPEWLTSCPGRVVVVKGRELVGVFDSEDEALAAGARRFGLAPVLVRRVQAVPEEADVPALALGILHAGPALSVPK